MIPAGEALEILAPHEPRPLHQEFRTRYGDSFTWEVVQDEPGECRVRIGKDRDRDGGSGGTHNGLDSRDEPIDVIAELDVRDRPPAQRHEAIFSAYDDLSPGEAFVLVNDHDPKPLYHQFDAEAGDDFRWQYRLRDPGEIRVLIGKAASDSGTPGEDDGIERPF